MKFSKKFLYLTNGTAYKTIEDLPIGIFSDNGYDKLLDIIEEIERHLAAATSESGGKYVLACQGRSDFKEEYTKQLKKEEQGGYSRFDCGLIYEYENNSYIRLTIHTLIPTEDGDKLSEAQGYLYLHREGEGIFGNIEFENE